MDIKLNTKTKSILEKEYFMIKKSHLIIMALLAQTTGCVDLFLPASLPSTTITHENNVRGTQRRTLKGAKRKVNQLGAQHWRNNIAVRYLPYFAMCNEHFLPKFLR